jgi:DNA-binding transcriptional MerR regulator
MATAAARGLRVAELAAAVDVPPDTIRYYGRAGLLPAPDRTAAGYREYAEAAVDRLRFIRGAQRLGLRLADIRMPPRRPRHRHLPLRAGRAAPAPAAGRVDAEIAALTALRAEMVAMADALPTATCPPPSPGTWCPPEEGGDPPCSS